MTEPGAVSLEESQRQVVQLLLLTKSDEELLAELGVEEDLLFFKLQFWFPSLSPYRGTEGGDVVTDVVNTGFLNIVSGTKQEIKKNIACRGIGSSRR